VIESARVGDAGIYVCIARNSAGTALSQITLQVQGLFRSEVLLTLYQFSVVCLDEVEQKLIVAGLIVLIHHSMLRIRTFL